MTDRYSWLKFLIFAVLCTAISIGIAAVIGNWRFGDATSYSAEFASAQGLLVNDAVKISGVTVGKVTGIDVTERGTALVEFKVDDEYGLTDDSRVLVRWRDVFGLRFLYVERGEGQPTAAGHVYDTTSTVGAPDLNTLLDQLVPVMTALDPELQNQVLESLATGLVGRDDEVQAILADGGKLLEALASRDTEIELLIQDATTIISAYSARRGDLTALLSSFADVAESLASRNDLLVSSVVAVADAQEDLDRLLRANDVNLRAALDEAEAILTVVTNRTDQLDEIMEGSGQGLIAYHLVSRLGQWFNIAVPGASSGGDTFTNRNGAELPDRDPNGGPATAGAAGFFSTGG
jgi:phospholipid/cholesterol/gamma-HCH transport system substrate-binding protein